MTISWATGIIKLITLHKSSTKSDFKSYLINNYSSFMNQNYRSYKSNQSRNIPSSLAPAKSMGANIDNLSFLRPQSMKGDISIDKFQSKKNTKSK